MVGFFVVLTLLINAALSREVHGGPTQPLAALELINPGLQEISPHIQEVVVRQGDPFIEVYLKAEAALNCYDVREYDVERHDSKTRIIPRLRRSKPGEPCEQKMESFEDKMADLDPNLESAYSLEILGFMGWISKEFPKP
jgi:hypothetical protein